MHVIGLRREGRLVKSMPRIFIAKLYLRHGQSPSFLFGTSRSLQSDCGKRKIYVALLSPSYRVQRLNCEWRARNISKRQLAEFFCQNRTVRFRPHLSRNGRQRYADPAVGDDVAPALVDHPAEFLIQRLQVSNLSSTSSRRFLAISSTARDERSRSSESASSARRWSSERRGSSPCGGSPVEGQAIRGTTALCVLAEFHCCREIGSLQSGSTSLLRELGNLCSSPMKFPGNLMAATGQY